MKDITHYFASPPKSVENVEAVKLDVENPSAPSERVTNKTEKNVSEIRADVKAAVKTPAEKRSRVKIKISLNSSKNRRCDITSSKDDLVDKTPSPFKKSHSKNSPSYDKINCQDNPASETPNAFKLLMNRTKPATTARGLIPTPSPRDLETAEEYKDKLCQSEEKLLALADKKGEYSKRKHAEIEEAETIENGLKKRAKLFRREDKEEAGMKGEGDGRKKRRKDTQTGRKSLEGEKARGQSGCDNNNLGRRKKIMTKTNGNEERKLPKQSENPASFVSPCFGKRDITPRTKTKWTMRVKLQSNFEDENGEDDGTAADEDYIFTPKSKRKFEKTRIRKPSGNGETREIEKPGEKDDAALEKSSDLTRCDVSNDKQETKDLRRGKHKAKKNRIEMKSTEDRERNSDCDIVILDTSSTEINDCPIILQEKKLAPLFVKRPKPNLATLEARRSFLQSGIPENVKKIIIAEQKASCNELGTSTMPFPIISHISQSCTELDSEIESSVKSYESFYRYKPEQDNRTVVDLDLSQFKSLSKMGEEISRELGKNDTEKFVQIERENFETVLKDIESRCSDTRTMWESVSSTALNQTLKKSPKRRSKKLKIQKKSDDVQNEDNLNPTWTCKYKPINSSQVVGNETAIAKLRNWLNGWRLPSNKDDRSSGDEFYSSDCSGSSYYENNQVAVLIGPHGSGKSASVYAIAEELGYRVLEVNASSRRTGKKILTHFQEATKSHRVKRDQSTLMPMKKKPSEKKVPQNSLILIEDVDLIFEEDEGFVSATFQLAANTRRPIVMTCKEPCSHLNKMAPQQQFIHFHAASGNKVSALLELIALAESGYRLPRPCLDTLLRNGDLRQSLLQLQYILQSGPPSITQLGTSAGSTLWQDMQPLIYKPAIKLSKKLRKESTDDKLLAKEKEKLMNTLAKKLDNISLISSLAEVENPASPPWSKELIPSLSLSEDFKPYSNSEDLSCEIADWLRRISLRSDRTTTTSQTNCDSRAQLAVKRKVKLGIDLALSQAIPSTLEHRSKAIDYLPIIRTMCRSEEDRASINTKRGNRFHNYLHGLNLASASSNILAAASSVFKDKF